MQAATTKRGTSGVANPKAIRTVGASKTHCKAKAFCTSGKEGARKDWHVFLEAMPLCMVKASAPVNCRTSMYDSRLSPGMGLLADRAQPA